MRFYKALTAALLALVISLTNLVLPVHASYMQIFIRTQAGYTWMVDVEPNNFIYHIKQLIQDRMGFSPNVQNLIYRGKTLQNDRTLSDYNIQRDSILDVEWTPFGSPPTLNVSSAGEITPGGSVTFFIANSKKDCQATAYWSGINEVIDPVTATVKNSGKTAPMTLITPSTAGIYTLRTSSFYYSCSGGHIAGLSRSITVGKALSIVAKLSTSSGYVAKNPIISISGNLRSGANAVPAKVVSISLMLGDVEVQTIPATTNSSGVFSANFGGITYAPGAYTAVVSTESDSTYITKTKTTAILKLR